MKYLWKSTNNIEVGSVITFFFSQNYKKCPKKAKKGKVLKAQQTSITNALLNRSQVFYNGCKLRPVGNGLFIAKKCQWDTDISAK
jgi:hypothetical protein